MEVNETQVSGCVRTRAFVVCAKIGTKRADGLVEAILFLIGCELRFGELPDRFFEPRDFLI